MKTADLIDLHADKLTLVHLAFQAFGQRDDFCGQIETVACFEDNQLVKDILSTAGNGRVLVIDGSGSTRTALVGDMIASLAQENGWAGIIVNGAIRDSVAINQMDFAIQALGKSPVKSRKDGVGEIGVSVSFGGVTLSPGQWISADADGVLISDQNLF
ncbi:MAG: ribonuclease E activity regulator RraA [Pseudomonadota bacterium]